MLHFHEGPQPKMISNQVFNFNIEYIAKMAMSLFFFSLSSNRGGGVWSLLGTVSHRASSVEFHQPVD